MSGHLILLNLIGGIALLLWGTQMVQTGILRGYGGEMRSAIARIAGRPVLSVATGTFASMILQSATATALLLCTFASRGLIALPEGLALMLGADLGTTLVVQALSFNLKFLIPILLLAGVITARFGDGRPKQVARMLVGFALILVALGMIVAASDPLRDSPRIAQILLWLSSDAILAVITGALLTWLMHSSVAFVLFVISLTTAGIIALPFALLLVLGANLGAGMIPLGLTLHSPLAARRVLWGNLIFRASGMLAALALITPITTWIGTLGGDSARQVAHFHTLFNAALVLIFLPLTGIVARKLETLMPDHDNAKNHHRLDLLDPTLHDRPALALNAATRALMQLSDKVELMLREAILTFLDRDEKRIQYVASLEEEVDVEQEEIKLYLARQMQHGLDAKQSAQVLELVLFTTNLEHIGDIIDKGLLRLASKRQRQDLHFSEAGWADIQAFHHVVSEQMQLAMTVFVSRDVDQARDLVTRKDWLRGEELKATERHFDRLREGKRETIETSALHLDVLRDLKRINAHLTTVAYPVLEPAGVLRGSRLKAVPSPDKASKGRAYKAG